MKDAKLYMIMARDGYRHGLTGLGGWSIIQHADNEAAGRAAVQRLRRAAPSKRYRLVEKAIIS
jgi:hypothetical protein